MVRPSIFLFPAARRPANIVNRGTRPAVRSSLRGTYCSYTPEQRSSRWPDSLSTQPLVVSTTFVPDADQLSTDISPHLSNLVAGTTAGAGQAEQAAPDTPIALTAAERSNLGPRYAFHDGEMRLDMRSVSRLVRVRNKRDMSQLVQQQRQPGDELDIANLFADIAEVPERLASQAIAQDAYPVSRQDPFSASSVIRPFDDTAFCSGVNPQELHQLHQFRWHDSVIDLFNPQVQYELTDHIDDAFRSWLSTPVLQNANLDPGVVPLATDDSVPTFNLSDGIGDVVTTNAGSGPAASEGVCNQLPFSPLDLARRYSAVRDLWPLVEDGPSLASSIKSVASGDVSCTY